MSARTLTVPDNRTVPVYGLFVIERGNQDRDTTPSLT